MFEALINTSRVAVVKRALAVAHGESSLSYTAYNVVSNNCEHFASWCRSEHLL